MRTVTGGGAFCAPPPSGTERGGREARRRHEERARRQGTESTLKTKNKKTNASHRRTLYSTRSSRKGAWSPEKKASPKPAKRSSVSTS